MEIIIFLLIIWLFLTIIKKILLFLFGHNNNQKTSAYNVESDGNKPPDLKYKNAVYISFRRKVYKAFETLKKEGYFVTWDLDGDGFLVPGSDSLSEGSEIYAVAVHFDDKNIFGLKDPYYILVTCGVLFRNSDTDRYKKMTEFLNKFVYEELKQPGVFYNVDHLKNEDFGVCYCNLVVSNNKNLYEETKKLGEAEVFKRVFKEARQGYYDGVATYRARYGKSII